MSKESYKAFGRGTPAGNAVYNLYNGKKNMDSTLDPDLLARLQKMRKEKEELEKNTVKPKVVPKSQAHVNVPKPTNGRKPPSAEQVAEWRLQALGRRKRLDDILADTQSASATSVPLPPKYNKPARTDADKTKLQQIMEHGEELPPMQVMPKVLINRLGQTAQKSRRDILSAEFDRIAASVAERRRDLKILQEKQAAVVASKASAESGVGAINVSNAAIASLRAEETQLLIEIGRLVSEMKQVDKDISEIPEDED